MTHETAPTKITAEWLKEKIDNGGCTFFNCKSYAADDNIRNVVRNIVQQCKQYEYTRAEIDDLIKVCANKLYSSYFTQTASEEKVRKTGIVFFQELIYLLIEEITKLESKEEPQSSPEEAENTDSLVRDRLLKMMLLSEQDHNNFFYPWTGGVTLGENRSHPLLMLWLSNNYLYNALKETIDKPRGNSQKEKANNIKNIQSVIKLLIDFYLQNKKGKKNTTTKKREGGVTFHREKTDKKHQHNAKYTYVIKENGDERSIILSSPHRDDTDKEGPVYYSFNHYIDMYNRRNSIENTKKLQKTEYSTYDYFLVILATISSWLENPENKMINLKEELFDPIKGSLVSFRLAIFEQTCYIYKNIHKYFEISYPMMIALATDIENPSSENTKENEYEKKKSLLKAILSVTYPLVRQLEKTLENLELDDQTFKLSRTYIAIHTIFRNWIEDTTDPRILTGESVNSLETAEYQVAIEKLSDHIEAIKDFFNIYKKYDASNASDAGLPRTILSEAFGNQYNSSVISPEKAMEIANQTAKKMKGGQYNTNKKEKLETKIYQAHWGLIELELELKPRIEDCYQLNGFLEMNDPDAVFTYIETTKFSISEDERLKAYNGLLMDEKSTTDKIQKHLDRRRKITMLPMLTSRYEKIENEVYNHRLNAIQKKANNETKANTKTINEFLKQCIPLRKLIKNESSNMTLTEAEYKLYFLFIEKSLINKSGRTAALLGLHAKNTFRLTPDQKAGISLFLLNAAFTKNSGDFFRTLKIDPNTNNFFTKTDPAISQSLHVAVLKFLILQTTTNQNNSLEDSISQIIDIDSNSQNQHAQPPQSPEYSELQPRIPGASESNPSLLESKISYLINNPHPDELTGEQIKLAYHTAKTAFETASTDQLEKNFFAQLAQALISGYLIFPDNLNDSSSQYRTRITFSIAAVLFYFLQELLSDKDSKPENIYTRWKSNLTPEAAEIFLQLIIDFIYLIAIPRLSSQTQANPIASTLHHQVSCISPLIAEKNRENQLLYTMQTLNGAIHALTHTLANPQLLSTFPALPLDPEAPPAAHDIPKSSDTSYTFPAGISCLPSAPPLEPGQEETETDAPELTGKTPYPPSAAASQNPGSPPADPDIPESSDTSTEPSARFTPVKDNPPLQLPNNPARRGLSKKLRRDVEKVKTADTEFDEKIHSAAANYPPKNPALKPNNKALYDWLCMLAMEEYLDSANADDSDTTEIHQDNMWVLFYCAQLVVIRNKIDTNPKSLTTIKIQEINTTLNSLASRSDDETLSLLPENSKTPIKQAFNLVHELCSNIETSSAVTDPTKNELATTLFNTASTLFDAQPPDYQEQEDSSEHLTPLYLGR